MTSDQCSENLKKIIASIPPEENLNEATTRFRYIDRIFQECLNWDTKNITTEEHSTSDGNYVDYIFTNPRRILIVEAKREGVHFDIPSAKNNRVIYSLPHLLESSPSLKKAVEQVFGYCTTRGVQIAAVANGRQLIVFIASRIDGSEPLKGNALVFASLESMRDNFLQLWQALSPEGIQVEGLRKQLSDLKVEEVPAKLKEFVSDYPGIKRKTDLQQDLEILSELLFEEVMTEGEIEENFLRDCYCQSEYLSNFTLQSKKILESRYSRLSALGVNLRELSSLGSSLLDPKNIKNLTTRKPILLLGDVNVGKTSFIRNLMKVEAPEILSKFVNIYIDFHTQANFEEDLGLFVKRELSSQLRDLYKIDIEERNFVRGVYREELKNLTRGIYADLKTVNPNRLVEKEIEYLEVKTQDSVSHLKKALSHLIKNDRQVVIFLDNSDQRSDVDQEKTFLIGQELANDFGITVFISLRPESFEKFKKKGLLAGYYSRVFTIRPPALEDVIRKRLEFVIRLAKGELKIKSLESGVKLETILKLVKIFLYSLEKDSRIPECIENISSGNVATALDIMRDFFSNPHVAHEKILTDSQREHYVFPVHYLLESIINKQHKYFYPLDSYVLNIFDISTNDSREYFLTLTILSILKLSKADSGFEKIIDLNNKLQDVSFLPAQIDYSLGRLLFDGLIESILLGGTSDGSGLRQIRITEKGAYHLARLAKDFSYFDSMIVDTPVIDDNVRAAIGETNSLKDRVDRVQTFCNYLDEVWDKAQIPTDIFSWPDYSANLKIEIQKISAAHTSNLKQPR